MFRKTEFSEEHARILSQLRAIRPGEQVIYFRGVAFRDCPLVIRIKLGELCMQGKIVTVQRRIERPQAFGAEDWVEGVGTFEYIAQGIEPPKTHVSKSIRTARAIA